MDRRSFLKKSVIAAAATQLDRSKIASVLSDITTPVSAAAPVDAVFVKQTLVDAIFGLQEISDAQQGMQYYAKIFSADPANMSFADKEFLLDAAGGSYLDSNIVDGAEAFQDALEVLQQCKPEVDLLLPEQIRIWTRRRDMLSNPEEQELFKAAFHMTPEEFDAYREGLRSYCKQGRQRIKQLVREVFDIDADDELALNDAWVELQEAHEKQQNDLSSVGYGDETLAVSEKPFEHQPQRFVSDIEQVARVTGTNAIDRAA